MPFALNFLSTVRLIRKALPYMQKQRWGRIVSVMSMSVKEPLDGLILSNGVRPAVVGMAKTLSREVGQYNITVNTVLPGRILTDRLTGALGHPGGKGRYLIGTSPGGGRERCAARPDW